MERVATMERSEHRGSREERVLGFGATVAPQARACLSANTMTTKKHEVPQELLVKRKLDTCRMGAHCYNFCLCFYDLT